MNKDTPYSIPELRDLKQYETDLLSYLCSKEKPEWLDAIPKLKVIARCGCGDCPTVMFGTNFSSVVMENEAVVIDYYGKDKNGYPIGVLVFGNNIMPTELEFYSVDGQAETISYPDTNTLRPLKELEQ